MTLTGKLRGLIKREAGETIRVELLVRGRIGAGWESVEETFRLRAGATLRDLVEAAARGGLDLPRLLAESPHLASTMMLNGERCPLEQNLDRPLADGDQLYLLSPLAGG